MEKVVDDVQTVKFTIKKFLELFRNIFNADACYLYLINTEMDDHEKEMYLRERIKIVKDAYKRRKKYFPPELKCYETKDPCYVDEEILKSIDILKFIDVAKKEEVDGWNLTFDNRPAKYVLFKKFTNKEEICGEGLTAYIVRAQKALVFNSHEEIQKHPSSSLSNRKNNIAPDCKMIIGLPLTDEKDEKKGTIGVLKIEKYTKNEDNFDERDSRVLEVQNYIPLLIQLVKSSADSFKENSYEKLFKGINLLDNLEKMELSDRVCISSPNKTIQDKINKSIYEDTLHLFLVLKRNEFVGYEEILTRITHYVMGIGSKLGLKGEVIKSFEDNLNRFRKHEELLLSGLNNYRDHFIHQFHVFVIGYIIINELGIDIFRSRIEKSMYWILSHNNKDFDENEDEYRISDSHVLRIWFLTAFYHDHAYILEKLDRDLEAFFENVLGYKFSVKFDWEKLLTSDGNFSKHICDLLKYFSSKNGTNTDILLQNYLNAIIGIHDHGVLGALLLIHSSERIPNKNYKESLYAALAISLHNYEIYKDLKEGEGSNKAKSVGISFESFPIAFLLTFCDTAQSFGRLEMKEGIEASEFPVKFLEIDSVKGEKVTLKLQYLDKNRVPSDQNIKKWAHEVNEFFTSKNYSFVIEYYKPNERDQKPNERDLICSISF